MPLTLYNTLTRRKAPFEPLDPNHVRMYVCGPTVYAFAHIGNARPIVVFDVLYRMLRRYYPRVTYVRNITDVDDKIINASRNSGESIAALTKRTEEAFHQDVAALGALAPDVEPRATAHIPQMIEMIEKLLETANAYEAEGHILFHVPSLPNYGRLSGRNREEMIAGARVDIAPYKRDPADFVLWKPSASDEPAWDSPWGRGRPGWHIECSAMSKAHLGTTFDIHGGGQDLIFPHHENELAQSTCALGTREFARYWVHNGHLDVSGEKMSKSLGNIFTVRELLEDGWPGEVLRLALLSSHYRQPLDFTREGLKQARANLDRIYTALRTGRREGELGSNDAGEVTAAPVAALDDDLNTPLALARMHDLAGAINRETDSMERVRLGRELQAAGDLLGLLQADPEAWFQGKVGATDVARIDDLIVRRTEARERKDYTEADRIRTVLEADGILLEDGPSGTTWRRAG